MYSCFCHFSNSDEERVLGAMFLLYTPEERVTSLQERWEKYLGTLSCSFCINVYVLLPPPINRKFVYVELEF